MMGIYSVINLSMENAILKADFGQVSDINIINLLLSDMCLAVQGFFRWPDGCFSL